MNRLFNFMNLSAKCIPSKEGSNYLPPLFLLPGRVSPEMSGHHTFTICTNLIANVELSIAVASCERRNT